MTGIRNSVIHGTMAGHDPGGGQTSPWLELAAAIVKTAADDYVRVLQNLWGVSNKSATDTTGAKGSKGSRDSKDTQNSKSKVTKKKVQLMAEKAELEDFFYSSWYETLTDIDPNRLIYQCKVTAKAKEQAAIERANRKKIKALMKDME